MRLAIHRFLADDRGAAIEYGLIAALVSVSAITALQTMGESLRTIFEFVTAAAGSAAARPEGAGPVGVPRPPSPRGHHPARPPSGSATPSPSGASAGARGRAPVTAPRQLSPGNRRGSGTAAPARLSRRPRRPGRAEREELMRRKSQGSPVQPDADEDLRWRQAAAAPAAFRARARQARRRVDPERKRRRGVKRLA